MSIVYNHLTDTEYRDGRFALIRLAEGYNENIYIDSEGYVTIGVGFNLHSQDVRDSVFTDLFQLTVDLYGTGAEVYINQIKDLFAVRYSTSENPTQQAEELALINTQVLAILSEWRHAYHNDLGGPGSEDDHLNFTAPGPLTLHIAPETGKTTRDRIKDFFEGNFSQEYEDKVDSNIAGIPDSYERLALFSLAYNQTDGPTALIGDKLKAAFATGDRAEAWYEIRYNSGNQHKRRYVESEVFGLYGADEINEENMIKVLQMYTRHREHILQYDSETATGRSLANGDLSAMRGYAPGLFVGSAVNPINVELVHAREWIKQFSLSEISREIAGAGSPMSALDWQQGEFLIGDTDLNGGVNDIISGSDEYPLSGSDLILGLTGNDVISGGEGNDFILGGDGDDNLYGENGDDDLLGGIGSDTLNGEAGTDFLYGGAGNDTYVMTRNFGQDFIADIAGESITLDFSDYSYDEIELVGGQQIIAKVKSSQTDSVTLLTSNLIIDSIIFSDRTLNGAEAITVLGDDDNNVLVAMSFSDSIVYGFGGNDVIGGSTSGNYLDGGKGNDHISGKQGNDTLVAGGGTDQVSGGEGNDTYKLVSSQEEYNSLEAGQNVVNIIDKESYGPEYLATADSENDVLDLSHTSSSSLKISRSASDLKIKHEDNLFEVNLKGYFNPDFDHIETLITADGVFDLREFSSDAPYIGNHIILGGDDDYLIDNSSSPKYIDTGDGNDFVQSKSMFSTFLLGTGNDVLKAYAANTVDAGAGEDQIYLDGLISGFSDYQQAINAGDGDDWVAFRSTYNHFVEISGGNGNDVFDITVLGARLTLNGGNGDDYYRYNDLYFGGVESEHIKKQIHFVGQFGNDIVDPLNNMPVLAFPEIAAIEQLAFHRIQNDALIITESGESSVRIRNYYLLSDIQKNNASIIIGSQSQAIVITSLLDNAEELSEAGSIPLIRGSLLNDGDIVGSDADEKLISHNTNDRLIGGQGNDILVGGRGNDTYLFGYGDGADIINNEGVAGDYDVVEFGENVLPENIVVSVDPENSTDLVLLLANTSDQITISQYFNSENMGFYSSRMVFKFSDGTIWRSADIQGFFQNGYHGTTDPDSIIGDFSADNIYGYEGDDFLAGRSGDDLIEGHQGQDTLMGDEGHDQLFGGDDADYIYGGQGNDFINGDSGEDYLYGDEGNDIIYAEGGNDNAYGGQGSDTVYGGSGNDFINGGDGDDFIDAGEGDDSVYAGSGIDQVWGGQGQDVLIGAADNDLLYGGDDADRLFGEGGSDVLNGDAGDDYLVGHAGNDILIGSQGNDQLYGEHGDDFYQFDSMSGIDRIYDWEGYDIIQIDHDISPENVTVTQLADTVEIQLTETDKIILSGYFDFETGNLVEEAQIEEIRFLNGTIWTSTELLSKIAPDTTAPNVPSGSFNESGTMLFGNAEYGSTVFVKNANGDLLASTIVYENSGDFLIDFPSFALTGKSIYVTAVDFSGNSSNQLELITPDKEPPSAPQLQFDNTHFVLSGTAEANSIVIVRSESSDLITKINVTDAAGNFSIPLDGFIIDGQRIYTSVLDSAGNESETVSTNIELVHGLRGSYYGYQQSANGNIDISNISLVSQYIQNKAPNATFLATQLKYGPGTNGLGMGLNLQSFLKQDASSLSVDPVSTSDAILKFDGKIHLEAGSYNFRVRADDGYRIMVDGAIVAQHNANQGATTRTHAAFSIPQPGLHDIQILYWDAGGGHELGVELGVSGTGLYSYLGVDQLFVTDVPTLTDITPPTITSAIFGENGDQVSGQAEAGTIVQVKAASGVLLGSAFVDDIGNFTVLLNTALSNGEAVKLIAKDLAGNYSTIAHLFAPDTTAPDIPNIVFDPETQKLIGTAEQGSKLVVMSAADEPVGEVIVNQSGQFELPLNGLVYDGQTVKAFAEDTAGNRSQEAFTVVDLPDLPVPTYGLKGSYYGYQQSANGNVDMSNLTLALSYISDRNPNAAFVATHLQYGLGTNGLGMGSNLQTFLKGDAQSLSFDPASTSDAIVKFEGKVDLASGNYRFRVGADDGYQIRIDGVVVAERNTNQSATTRTHNPFSIPNSGLHDIEIIYWDAGGGHELGVEIGDATLGNFTYLSGEMLHYPQPETSIAMSAMKEGDIPITPFSYENQLLVAMESGSGVASQGQQYQNLIQAMASFAPADNATIQIPTGFYEDRNYVIAASVS